VIRECTTCKGTGEVCEERQIGVIGSGDPVECPDCDGAGEIEVTRCPWCGVAGLDFDESPRPSDVCHHDPAHVVAERPAPPMNSYAAWLAVRAQIEGRE
jgi:hypothetical protein